MDCHINVEVCLTIKAVKYLYKYMYKGHDKVVKYLYEISFAPYILAYCNPVNPRQLFMTFENAMTDDYTNLQRMSPNQARHTLLTTLRAGLESLGKNINDYNISDLCVINNDPEPICKEILDEQNFIISESDLKGCNLVKRGTKNCIHGNNRCYNTKKNPIVFPNLNEYANNNASTMTSSAILTPKNNHVDEINIVLSWLDFPEMKKYILIEIN